MTVGIGHNGGPTFDDVVRENLDRGLLLSMKEVIVEAVRDPRLERRHLRVLAEVMACLNSQTGLSYPSRKVIADNTKRYDLADGEAPTFGYTEAGINKTISELVDHGYLISTKRAAEQGGRALSLYTIRKPSTEELQDQITEWIMAQRKPRKSKPWRPSQLHDSTPVGKVSHLVSVPTPVGKVTPADPTPVDQDRAADPTPVGGDTHVGKDRADFTSDSTYVDRTVTNRKELIESVSVNPAGASATPPPLPPSPPPLPTLPVYPAGGHGEEHKGHGVYVNGETVRHASFAISLPGISMQTIASGLTATEVKDRCVAHALQWAVEIENGRLPRDVLPSKIANFLSRSIMGEVNQSKIQTVRETRERQPFSARPVVSPDGKTVETQSERLSRIAADMERQKSGARG